MGAPNAGAGTIRVSGTVGATNRSHAMSRRQPNHRLVKIHRNYTVEEVALRLRVHKNTVRSWLRVGLPTIDASRPTLIHGQDLSRFLMDRRRRARIRCQPGEIFCVKCRVPRVPAGRMVDYIPLTGTSGNLRGICPSCGILIHRRISSSAVSGLEAVFDVVVLDAPPRIGEQGSPSVISDFNAGDSARGDA